jgi:hypothetical protein
MATMSPNIINNHNNSTQMSTPIDTLPLKTTRDVTDIEDPMVQSVLKEFEQDTHDQPSGQNQGFETNSQINQQIQYAQHVQPVQQVQPIQQVQQLHQAPVLDNLRYSSYTNKKLFDIDIAKRSAIITLVTFLIYYSNISLYVLNKLPDNVKQYTSGREILINMFVVFVIFYAILYFDLL